MPSRSFLSLELGGEKGLVAWAKIPVEDLELLRRELARVLEHQASVSHVVGNSHLVHRGGLASTGVVVEEGGWLRNVYVVEHAQMPQSRFPSPVWRLVLAHQEERFVFVSLVQPIERSIGYQIRGVPLVGHSFAISH